MFMGVSMFSWTSVFMCMRPSAMIVGVVVTKV